MMIYVIKHEFLKRSNDDLCNYALITNINS